MTIQSRQVTAEELLEMPEDSVRHELVEGSCERWCRRATNTVI